LRDDLLPSRHVSPRIDGGMTRWENRRLVTALWIRVWNLVVAICISIGVQERGYPAEPGTNRERGPQSAEYDWAIAILSNFVPREALVLDLGCGESYGLNSLVAHGFRGIGLDPDLQPLRTAHLRHPTLRLVVAKGDRVPFAHATFDAVTAIESMEHMPNPIDALREVRRVLRDQGMFLVSTPLADHQTTFHSRYHTFEWTAEELQSLLSETGYSVLLTQKVDFTSSLGEGTPRPLTERLAAFLQRFVELPVPLPPKETVLVLARATS
jgi:SAM-dependent methyltransferase